MKTIIAALLLVIGFQTSLAYSKDFPDSLYPKLNIQNDL